MLIFGDVATQALKKNHKIREIEIIYNDLEEQNYIIDSIGLKDPIHDGIYHQVYKKEGLIYKLYGVSISMMLRKMVKDNFGYKFKKAYADPLTNFILDSVKVVSYHAKFDDWLSRMDSFTFLADEYVQDMLAHDDIFGKLINVQHRMLKKFVNVQEKIVTRPYTYRPYNVIPRNRLLATITTSMVNYSPLHLITIEDAHLSKIDLCEELFDNLTYQAKITAAVESLYIDTLNEFVIPAIKDSKYQPSDKEVYRAYKKCIMYRCTQERTSFLADFMMSNYRTILEEYEIGFYTVFKNALKGGDLTIM